MSEQLNINADGNRIIERIEELELEIELAKDLEWLMENKRFKNVILNGYIGKLSIELFQDLTRPLILSGLPHDEVYAKLDAIRHLKYYLGVDDNDINGIVAENAIRANDQIDDLRKELRNING